VLPEYSQYDNVAAADDLHHGDDGVAYHAARLASVGGGGDQSEIPNVHFAPAQAAWCRPPAHAVM
jgi:hypothetical protein